MEHFEADVRLQSATAGIAGKRHETDGLIRVLFDSFWQPSPAGTRSAAMNVREIICRVGPYQIDFQVEAHPERNRLFVTGQLLDISQPEIAGPGVQVTLSNLRGIDMRTATNQFGEFCGELENSGDLELSFLARSGKPIVILLRGALEPSSGARA